MVSPSERGEGILGRSLVPFKKVPFEESRSERTHLPESGSKWMERCLEEMPESLMVSELPRTTRPRQMTDPGRNSMVSPSRGPFSIISFKIEPSSIFRTEDRERKLCSFRGKEAKEDRGGRWVFKNFKCFYLFHFKYDDV